KHHVQLQTTISFSYLTNADFER
ncbi:hypothetical protein Tsp_02334, partial [Trichinella spiralis]